MVLDAGTKTNKNKQTNTNKGLNGPEDGQVTEL